jgi:hypothetical protein
MNCHKATWHGSYFLDECAEQFADLGSTSNPHPGTCCRVSHSTHLNLVATQVNEVSADYVTLAIAKRVF